MASRLLGPLMHRWEGSPLWHERAAVEAVRRGHCQVIGDRARPEELYLLRMWLSLPQPDGRDNACDQGFRSASSQLLHYIAKPDADAAMHDHPWSFRTLILSGGYVEELPGFGWDPSEGGPRITRRVRHGVGSAIAHEAADLHRIASVEPNTWTLVNTGPRVRAWGFHPAGKLWQEFTP